MKRITWIDISRAIGMLTIIIAHSLNSYTGNYFSNILFAVNVPIFFVLSGYLHKDKYYSKIITGGFFNLLLPYIFTSFIMIMLTAVSLHFHPIYLGRIADSTRYAALAALYGAGTPINNLLGKFFIPAIGAIWFLLAMFLANIFYSFIIKLTTKYKVSGNITTIIFIVTTFIGFYIAKFIQLPWSLDAVLVSLIFYWFGFLIKKYNLVNNGNFITFIFAVSIWFVTAKIGPFYLNVSAATSYTGAIIGGVAGSYAIMVFSKWFANISPENITHIVQKYGELSLIVLCFHIIDISTLNITSLIQHVFLPHGMLIFTIALVIYRIIFTYIAIIIIPYIPIVRSFYMFRKYPFKLK